MSPDSSSAQFEFAVDGLDAVLAVTGFRGEEGMSKLYEFEIDLASETPDVAFDDVLGKPALLTIHTKEEDVRHVHGIVSCFEEIGARPRRTLYRATIVPRFWTLGLRQDCCIFQEMSTTEVIEQVLKEAGLASGEDFELRVEGDYPPREYCVQYRESDFAFVSRLMEEDGLFYFFEHTDAKHLLVIADHAGAYGTITGDATIVFKEGDSGLSGDDEHIDSVEVSREMRPGKVELKDFNFKKTTVNLASQAEGNAESDLEIYDYPGRYVDTDLGSTRSNVLIESLRAQRDLLCGESNARRLASGHKFKLDEHPRADFNAEYVLTKVSHVGRQAQAAGVDAGSGGADEDGDAQRAYEASFEAIPAAVVFRAPQVTPVATIEGPQTAIVTGPSGEEIHCDEHGRVKVQFHWDRLGKNDDKSSCWVRVAQMWSGGGYGGMVIPRIGNEVVVSFLEGDPDMPLITGHVYNGTSQFAYSLPGDKTRTSLKTYSSPGGGGFNELRFEDAAGSEEVYLHAQKDWNIEVLNDRTQHIGHDHTHTVENDETMEVKHNRARKVAVDETVTIGANETRGTGGDRTVTVDGNETLTVKGKRAQTVTGDDTLTLQSDSTVDVTGNSTVSVSGKQNVSVSGKQDVSIGGDSGHAVGGDANQSVTGKLTLDVGDKATVSFKSDLKGTVGKKLELEVSDEVSIVCGQAKLTLKKNGDVVIEGGKVNVKGSGDVVVKGSKVAIN